jgi:hypothetical protein
MEACMSLVLGAAAVAARRPARAACSLQSQSGCKLIPAHCLSTGSGIAMAIVIAFIRGVEVRSLGLRAQGRVV